MVAEMEPMTNAVLNDANIQIMIADGYEYLRGFRSFARKEDAEGNEYILIAEPVGAVEYEWRGLELEELTCEQSEDGNSITF